jgi:hypothetical protein
MSRSYPSLCPFPVCVMSRLGVAIVIAVALCACAKRADQVSASYVSPYQFDPLDCRQLADEAARVSARAAQAAGVQDQRATNDAVATGVAIVLFWPAAFLIGGGGQSEAELAQLRGQMEAIEQVAIRKRCNIVFQRGAPPAS